MQGHARPSKAMQGHAGAMQSHAGLYKTSQSHLPAAWRLVRHRPSPHTSGASAARGRGGLENSSRAPAFRSAAPSGRALGPAASQLRDGPLSEEGSPHAPLLRLGHLPRPADDLLPQRGVDLAHDVRHQLLHDGEGAELLLHLGCVRGARQRRGNVRVGHAPGQRQLPHAAAEPRRHGPQALCPLDLPLEVLEVRPPLEGILGEPRARGRGAPAVLPREDAGGQGGPDREAQAHAAPGGRRVEGGVLRLHAAPHEEVVLGLIGAGGHEAKPVGHRLGLREQLGAPLGGGPVEAKASVDGAVEAADHLLHWREVVGPVAEGHVNVVEPHALQGGLQALDDVLSGEADAVRGQGLPGPRVAPKHDLRREHQVLAVPSAPLHAKANGIAHNALGVAVGVSLRVVEKVDAAVIASLHDCVGRLRCSLPRIGRATVHGLADGASAALDVERHPAAQ
mmetsp:Transcript_100080/g.311824  ORF Transcript_100080/g.311824 Transcript_100080/m.311824 type:complete len:451 (-) Transcript_100080:120-1472(-)